MEELVIRGSDRRGKRGQRRGLYRVRGDPLIGVRP